MPNLTRYLKGFLAMSVCRFEAGTFPRQPMTVPCLVHLRLINGKFELDGDVTKWSGRHRMSVHKLGPNKTSQGFSLQCWYVSKAT